MANAFSIEFTEVTAPIMELVTKFGGQPVWLEKPQWPIGKSSGQPMQFIGQIALEQVGFGGGRGKVAYIFMDLGEHSDTFDPESGDNAVVLQPGNTGLPATPKMTGPTLERWHELPAEKSKSFFGWLNGAKKESVLKPCEFAVRLEAKPESVWPNEEEINAVENEELQEEMLENRHADLEGTKIGGTPLFAQNDEYPDGGPWDLLLQLDSCAVPFEINLGDAGIAYVFINPSRDTAKMLWQCF